MKQKILIIEDDFSNTKMYNSLLRYYNYDIIESLEGKEGIEKAKEHRPDIILLDLYSPGMDPYQVTRVIKMIPELSKTPVILLTSFAIEGDKKNAIDAGADGIIEKPVNPELFVSQMQAIVTSYKKVIQ